MFCTLNVVQNCCQTKISKFQILMWLFNLSQDLRKNVVCYPKLTEGNRYLPVPVFLDFFFKYTVPDRQKCVDFLILQKRGKSLHPSLSFQSVWICFFILKYRYHVLKPTNFSVPYGMKNISASPGDVQAELMESLRQLFPSWPTPTAVKCLKWRYSQV